MIEMIVVLGIFGLLSAVTIFNYGDFDRNITVTNLAYELALTIREAQSYSLSVRSEGGEFKINYGVSFYLNGGGANANRSFVFFADEPGVDRNGICHNDAGDYISSANETTCSYSNCTGSHECISSKLLARNTVIKRTCVLSNGSAAQSAMDYTTGACNDVSTGELSITFERPDVDAIIYAKNGAVLSNNYTEAAILLEATNGSQRAVVVRDNGQISVEFINN